MANSNKVQKDTLKSKVSDAEVEFASGAGEYSEAGDFSGAGEQAEDFSAAGEDAELAGVDGGMADEDLAADAGLADEALDIAGGVRHGDF